jgi:hypothetical protein
MLQCKCVTFWFRYVLQCCGPKAKKHAPQPSQLPPDLRLGSAPPASDSVEAADVYRPQQQQQIMAQQPGIYSVPPAYSPYSLPPAYSPYASQPPPAYAPQPGGGQQWQRSHNV